EIILTLAADPETPHPYVKTIIALPPEIVRCGDICGRGIRSHGSEAEGHACMDRALLRPQC
ncbi:MAG: hypothetical protein PHQ43_14505, partial [Dehalococcoidales bacterium]|nr:hypothetical protein [Dehalococcoidales bacterium]